MNGIILCFDDTPVRYSLLYRMATARGLIPIVTDDTSYARVVLANQDLPVVGVCLDYNIPGVDTEKFAQARLLGGIPTVITSNDFDGARRLSALFGKLPHVRMPAEISSETWARSVLDWFGTQPSSLRRVRNMSEVMEWR